MFEKRRKEAESRRKALLRSMPPTERRFKALLGHMGIRSYPQMIFFLDSDHYRIVDFYLPAPYRICIELDGPSHDASQNYDEWKDRKLTTQHRRFRVVRFKNDEVWHQDFSTRLQEVLNRYYIKPHHRKWVRPKWKRTKIHLRAVKPQEGTKTINLGWSIVQKSLKAESKKARYPGFKMQQGFKLRQLKEMGVL